MSAVGWETLAAQAPIVLIFAGAVFLLMREQARNSKAMMDTFMKYMNDVRSTSDAWQQKRDDTLNKTLERIADRLDAHDSQSRAHDAYVHERFKSLGE